VLSQGEQQHEPPEHLSALREACLLRHHHRCIVSRVVAIAEAITRCRERLAADDDGNPLLDSDNGQHVHVAHMITYCLAKTDDVTLDEAKKAAIVIALSHPLTVRLLAIFVFRLGIWWAGADRWSIQRGEFPLSHHIGDKRCLDNSCDEKSQPHHLLTPITRYYYSPVWVADGIEHSSSQP
jgi:hypothetical protein